MSTETVSSRDLKVRNVSFDLSEVPKHWVLGNPVMTHFVNSMHVVFPEGEKFFIRSVRRFQKDIKDKKLKKNVVAFCGQEGIHAREHEKFWEVLEDHGLEPERFADFLNTVAFSGKYSAESMIMALNKVSPRLGDKISLSVTTALEHYTAIFANAAFHEPIFTNDNMAPQMLELLHWHACEEIEHKAVCFDVLNTVDDSYWVRMAGMGIATTMLWGLLGIGQVYFLTKDKDVKWFKLGQESKDFATKLTFGKLGQGLAKNFFRYFRRDFHPNEIDDYYLLEEFFKDKDYA